MCDGTTSSTLVEVPDMSDRHFHIASSLTALGPAFLRSLNADWLGSYVLAPDERVWVFAHGDWSVLGLHMPFGLIDPV